MVAAKCYQRNDLSFDQAEMCHTYYVNNDFKLNIANKFVADHIPKHMV